MALDSAYFNSSSMSLNGQKKTQERCWKQMLHIDFEIVFYRTAVKITTDADLAGFLLQTMFKTRCQSMFFCPYIYVSMLQEQAPLISGDSFG